MTIAICDDDKQFCYKMYKLIQVYFTKKHVANVEINLYTSGDNMLKSGKNFDIALVDVEMEGISGIHAGHRLKSINPKTIFIVISAYDTYLDEALKLEAFRYLSKPLDRCRLYNALNAAMALYNSQNIKLVVETKDNNFCLLSQDIIMVEFINPEVHIYTTDYGELISTQSYSYWLDKLNVPPFYQTQKFSYKF